MKSINSIFIILALYCSQLFSQGWVPQTSNATARFRSVFFVDDQTGWAVGNNGLIRATTNGGTNWIIQTANSPLPWDGVFFTDPSTGYLCGGNGLIHKTINGGTSWTSITPGGLGALYCVYFINDLTGWFVGGTPQTPVMTTNGGIGFTHQSIPISGFIHSVKFIDAQTGFATLDAGGFIKTTNAGVNWVSYATGTGGTVWSTFFTDAETGYICTDGGGIRKTTNGGLNWSTQTSGTGQLLHWVYFPPTAIGNTGYICGWSGTILATINGGVNWTSQTSGTVQNLRSMHFPNTMTGWAVGDNGTILKTTTGGVTPFTAISTEVPETYELFQNYPNPFNPATKIKFAVPVVNGRDRLTLKIYDIAGKEVITLLNEYLDPGTYEVEWNASSFASGTYFYELKTENFCDVKKMVLVK